MERQIAACVSSPTLLPSLDDWAEAREQVDKLEEHPIFNDADGPGYVYNGGFISGPVDGKYNLIIERSEWTSTSLERLEGLLYELWVKSEVYA